jgi:hypothetical protein
MLGGGCAATCQNRPRGEWSVTRLMPAKPHAFVNESQAFMDSVLADGDISIGRIKDVKKFDLFTCCQLLALIVSPFETI